MTKVLDGIRVIDHGTFITGPFAAMLLADFGAEVIKVERRSEGDPYRSFRGGLYAPHFQANNRSKQSIGLDMNLEADRELLRSLISTADVYIQNFRPGVAEKLGLSAATLQKDNPKLIYCAISGFGATGPYAKRPAYDTVAQGMSGYLSMFVDTDQPRVQGPAIADTVTGLYGAYGILGALVARERTGKAPTVDLSMVEAMMHFASEPFANYFDSGTPWGPYDRARVSQSYALRCADGKLISLHLSSPEKFWEGLVTAAELRDLAADERFATRMARIHNHDALIDALRPVFARRSRDEWIRVLEANDVPHAPIYDLAEALEDVHATHLEVEHKVTHPQMGDVRMIRNPVSFDGDRSFSAEPPPMLDEHGAKIREAFTTGSKTAAE